MASTNLALENKLRRLLRIPLKLASGEDNTSINPVAESFTPPERDWVEKRASKEGGSGAEYMQHVANIKDTSAAPFEYQNPHRETIETLARLGESTKGEYWNSGQAANELFGHDKDGVPAFMGLNGVFSPLTAYKDHTGGAAMLTAAWLEAGKPRDDTTIRRLISAVDAYGKHYSPEMASIGGQLGSGGKYTGMQVGEGFGGTMRHPEHVKAAVRILQHTDKLRDYLEDPTGQGSENLKYLFGSGTAKVANFVTSFMHPMFGTALDTHMGRMLMHPDLDSFKEHSDILKQVEAHLSTPEEKSQWSNLKKQARQGLPVKSELVRAMMKQQELKILPGGTNKKKSAGQSVSNWLKDLNVSLLRKPQHYLAYKYAINEAAKKMGWLPAEVQEAAWTSIVGIMAANELGIPPKEIVRHLTADALRKGWQNHEAIHYPRLVDSLVRIGANKKALGRLGERLRQRATESSRPGILRRGDGPRIASIAGLLPGIAGPGHAAIPIKRALEAHLKQHGLFNEKTKKFQLQRPGEPLKFMTPDIRAFLRARLATPHDQAPGLVFADWLDENGYSQLANLHRHSHMPGDPMSMIAEDPHDTDRWHAMANALHEYGRPATAGAFAQLAQTGRPAGGDPRYQGSGRVWPKQLWNNILPNMFSQAGGGKPAVQFTTGGVPMELIPYGPSNTWDHTHYFARLGTHMMQPQDLDEGQSPYMSSKGGVFVPKATGEQMMNEADVFHTPRDAEAAAQDHTGNESLKTRLSRALSKRHDKPLQLMAQYDQPLDFGPTLDRVMASNQSPLIEGLKKALLQSGVNPQQVTPAVHDYGGMTRASVLAIGQASNPGARTAATAWTGLLGRQPGMLAFHGNPRGKDSVYVFHHHNADIVRNVLQQAGIVSRTIVPEGNHYKVYVYDPGNSVRSKMAGALSQLGAQATEWRGDGKVIGGDTDDMGRAQYRDVINKSEGGA